MRELRRVGGVDEVTLADLASAARLDTLEGIVHRYEIVDVVVQDEYTHDVIARARSGAYLVFDST